MKGQYIMLSAKFSKVNSPKNFTAHIWDDDIRDTVEKSGSIIVLAILLVYDENTDGKTKKIRYARLPKTLKINGFQYITERLEKNFLFWENEKLMDSNHILDFLFLQLYPELKSAYQAFKRDEERNLIKILETENKTFALMQKASINLKMYFFLEALFKNWQQETYIDEKSFLDNYPEIAIKSIYEMCSEKKDKHAFFSAMISTTISHGADIDYASLVTNGQYNQCLFFWAIKGHLYDLEIARILNNHTGNTAYLHTKEILTILRPK